LISGPREQLNQATSFLDGSLIYGSSSDAANSLRAHKGGRLNVQRVQDGELPPPTSSEACRLDPKHRCFLTGDARVNEHLGVAALHSLLVREHNRVAAGLEALNPHWADETLFQESRRIVSAELQHITYNEYLPLLLGQVRHNLFFLLNDVKALLTQRPSTRRRSTEAKFAYFVNVQNYIGIFTGTLLYGVENDSVEYLPTAFKVSGKLP